MSDDGEELSHNVVLQALSSSSLTHAEGVQHSSSLAGIGRANSADASLEALLAELSSASATAAAALVPFTSCTSAKREAAAVLNSTAASVGSSAAAQSPFASSTQQVPISSVFEPVLKAALEPTDGRVSQVQVSQLCMPSAASAAPSSSALSPRSSSPALAAASSASSLSSSALLESSHAGAQFVSQLHGEFQQHVGAFDDDLAFIHEVQTHQTLAAGMNPNVELQVLHKRFNSWKFDFKVCFCTADHQLNRQCCAMRSSFTAWWQVVV